MSFAMAAQGLVLEEGAEIGAGRLYDTFCQNGLVLRSSVTAF